MGRVYLRGLLLDGGRKSVEPMAARLSEDGSRQALAHFVTSSPWDAVHVRARLAWRMQPVIKPTALIIDDAGFLRTGTRPRGTWEPRARSPTATLGSLSTWLPTAPRRRRTGACSCPRPGIPPRRRWIGSKWSAVTYAIPAQAGHVEKWQLALDMIDETRSLGIEVPQVIADGGYGDNAAFRLGLEETWPRIRGGHLDHDHRATPGRTTPHPGRGRRPVPARRKPAQRVKNLVIEAGKSFARPVQWREGSRPRSGHKRMHSRFVGVRIRPAGRESRKAAATTGLPTRWLLAEWPADQDEPCSSGSPKLPETTPLPRLVRTAKLRWRIENDYRETKQALGLAHFEGRIWPG